MFAYLLLRDNKQSGPYSLEELKSIGIRSSDLFWIEGKSTSWCFPDEIEDLLAFVHASPISNRHSFNGSFDNERKENNNSALRYENRNEKRGALPIEKKSKYLIEKNTESEPVSKHTIEKRKNSFVRREQENFSSFQHNEIQNHDNSSYNYSVSNFIKIVIADDHRLFREGVKTALSQKSDIKIIGEAENGMQLMNLLKHHRPDVILLDIQMPVMDGISALASIRKLYADMKVIILSMHEGHSMVSTLMQAGANGYLTKTDDPENIYQAIKTCNDKNYYFNDLTNMSMLEGLRAKKKIPEKINTTNFDGAELMQRLATAQKKPGTGPLPKTQKSMLVAAGTILLISAAVIAGKTVLLGKSTSTMFVEPTKKTSDIPVASNLPALIAPSTADSAKVGTTDSLKQSIDSLKQPIDSLQKNAGTENILQAKNNASADIKKEADKLQNKKVKDSARRQISPSLQKIDSTVINIRNESSSKQSAAASPDLKAIAKNSIRNLVTADANEYHVGGFGGLSDIEITINNHSGYTIDETTVEVQYILSNSKVYKTETMNFQNIQSGSSMKLAAPKSSRGQKIEYKIVSIKSKELDLQ